MTYSDEFFTPDEVDSQIEHLEQERGPRSTDAEVLSYLRSFYATDADQDRRMLDQIWGRIMRESPPVERQQKETKGDERPTEEHFSTNRAAPTHQSHKRSSKIGQRLSALAAVAVVAVLVGSMIVVFNLVYRPTGTPNTTTASGYATRTPIATVSPTAIDKNAPNESIGNIVYSKEFLAQNGDKDVYALGWSTDSNRLGVASLYVQSWDATTGKNSVYYGGNTSGGIVISIAWSPDGKRVAVTGLGRKLEIYDAATGVLQATYAASDQAATETEMRGVVANYQVATNALSAAIPFKPASGGSGFASTAWSHDGKWLATALYGFGGFDVQVRNAETGVVACTYHGHKDEVGSISWSPDDRYIATSSIDGSTQVWVAQSGKTVYTRESHTRTDSDVQWSPTSNVIAYSRGTETIVFDPLSQKEQVKHASSVKVAHFVWSPDGRSIASAGKDIELWSVASGKTYYTFTKSSQLIRVLAWSPDGKYIASADSPEAGTSTIQVWQAR